MILACSLNLAGLHRLLDRLPGSVSLIPKSAASGVPDVLAATLRTLLEEGNASMLLL